MGGKAKGEGQKRAERHDKVARMRADARAYTEEVQERRARRFAAMLLADALDLVEGAPWPEALERDSTGAEYRAAVEGVEYRVNVKTGMVYEVEGNASRENRELGAPASVNWTQLAREAGLK